MTPTFTSKTTLVTAICVAAYHNILEISQRLKHP